MFQRLFFKILIFVAVVAIVFLGIRFLSGEDDWICDGGKWVQHGNPSVPMPQSGCGNIASPGIVVANPKENSEISSPYKILGMVTGENSWIGFEGQVGTVELFDDGGKKMANAILQASTSWMESPIFFQADLNFSAPESKSGKLIFKNENPSGLAENDRTFEVPISFAAEKIKVKVFFNNNKMDPQITCNKVFSVVRDVEKTEAIARAALEELLKGPTSDDLSGGYSTNINSGVVIQSLVIENGVAKADFNEQLQYQVGGSCRTSAIRAQIVETLKQFATVKNVVISINGETEVILQP